MENLSKESSLYSRYKFLDHIGQPPTSCQFQLVLQPGSRHRADLYTLGVPLVQNPGSWNLWCAHSRRWWQKVLHSATGHQADPHMLGAPVVHVGIPAVSHRPETWNSCWAHS